MPDQNTFPRYILLLAALVFFVVGIISATLSREAVYGLKDARKFERTLHKKEQVLKEEFPDLAEKINLRTPTEQDKRHGQAVAAARQSLPGPL